MHGLTSPVGQDESNSVTGSQKREGGIGAVEDHQVDPLAARQPVEVGEDPQCALCWASSLGAAIAVGFAGGVGGRGADRDGVAR